MPTSQKKPVDCSELAASLAELALAHGEAGASTLDAVVEAIRKDLPEVDRATVADAIVAYSKRAVNEAAEDTPKARVAKLKELARTDKKLRDKISDLETVIAGGALDAPKDPAMRKIYDDTIDKMRVEVDELRQEAVASDQVRKATDRLESGEAPESTPRATRPASEKTEALREQRDQINAQARVQEQIAEVERRIQEGEAPPAGGGKQVKDYGDKVSDLKKTLSYLRRQERLLNQTSDYESQLRTGNYKPTVSRAKRVLDEREERLVFARNRSKKQINREIEAAKPKTLFQKFVQSPFNEFRALMTGLEFSAVLRQGGFVALANPRRAAKNLIPMLKSFGSERISNRIDAEIRSRPNAMLYEKSGLFLPEPDAVMSPKKSEEAFDTDLPILGRIPGLKQALHGSARSYITFLNLLRADQFDVMVAALAKNGEPDPAQAKAIANFINVATGRGGLGKLEGAASTLNVALFAPRYVMSRFQLLLEPLRNEVSELYNPIADKLGTKKMESGLFSGDRETDKLIAKEYAKYAIGMTATLMFAELLIPGVEIEKDPRSTDFLKIKIGNARIDMLSGLQQAAVFMARQASGKTKSTTTGEVEDLSGPAARTNRWDVLAKFIRGKLSPLVGTAVDLGVGENVVGEPVTAKDLPMQLLTPITYRDIFDVLTGEYKVPEKTAMSMVALLGVGVQSFDPSAPRAPEQVVKVPDGEKEFYPGIGNTLRLTEDEYAKLLQAHEAGLAAIAEDEAKGEFDGLDQKETHEEKRRVYDAAYKSEKEAIVIDALDRLYPQQR